MKEEIYLLCVLLMILKFNNVTSQRPFAQQRKECLFGFSGLNCNTECSNFENENPKIIGGIEASPNSWPSTVYLLINFKNTKRQTISFSCGGTLIDEKTVLTAAHCVVQKQKYQNELITRDSVMIRFAAHDISKGDTKNTCAAQKVIIHPKYDEVSLLNDIALLRLPRNQILTNKIQIAGLPGPFLTPSTNSIVTAVGWGATVYKGSRSDLLRQVNLTVYDGAQCNYKSTNWITQICAGDIAGRKSTCQGDSGGALFYKNPFTPRTKYVLLGITSYGPDGCQIIPGVYTRVSAYLNWILQNK